MKTKSSINRRQAVTLGAGAVSATLLGLPFAAHGATKRIGFAMETFTVPRWKNLDRPNFETAVRAGGYEPVVNQADFKVDQQMADVENLVTRGVDCLAIVAVVAEAGINMARRAKREGIPVIAYNTAIPSKDVDVYVSRDNRGVGRKVAGAAKTAGKLKGNWVIVSGQAGNTVAEEMTQGFMDVVQPEVAAGRVKIISQKFHDGWDPETARRQAEAALTVTGNKIDGFLCNNDGMAGGVIAALDQVGLAGKVFVSGMDASSDACRRIIEGKMALSSFTRFDEMGKVAGELAVRLAKGEKLGIKGQYDAGKGVLLPHVPIEDFNVTRDNIVAYIKRYSPDYVDVAAVFKGIPKAQWPAGAEELFK